MATQRRNSRQGLLDAAVRLIARRGVKATTVRSIAREAGVTEGAIYRHFSSKEELYLDVYLRTLEEMIQAKRAVAFSKAPLRDKLREWVRVSYEFFDRHPDAFTFVLLVRYDLPEPEREMTTVQGKIFINLVKEAQAAGEMKPMLPELALSHFTGILLNVPRLINERVLEGPASNYVDDVADAIVRALTLKP
jgi:AcrR family transcriptional regulator